METLPVVAIDVQFGHALDHILQEILLTDLSLGPAQLMKIDPGDGFYRIGLNIDDIPKSGVVFPAEPGQEPLIAFPLILLMGWKNIPQFSALQLKRPLTWPTNISKLT